MKQIQKKFVTLRQSWSKPFGQGYVVHVVGNNGKTLCNRSLQYADFLDSDKIFFDKSMNYRLDSPCIVCQKRYGKSYCVRSVQ